VAVKIGRNGEDSSFVRLGRGKVTKPSRVRRGQKPGTAALLTLIYALIVLAGLALLGWGAWYVFTVFVLGSHLIPVDDNHSTWAGIAMVVGLLAVVVGFSLLYAQSRRNRDDDPEDET
jgi:TRAP-type C4-dicarboxylate transport system permease small subunit